MLFILIEAQQKKYGLESSAIEEVIPSIPLDLIPGAPSHIVGQFLYRKRMVNVIDFTQIIEKRPSRRFLSTRIIIMKDMNTSSMIGLRAENAVDCIEIPSEYVKIESNDRGSESLTFGYSKFKENDLIYCLNAERLFKESLNWDEKFFSLDYTD